MIVAGSAVVLAKIKFSPNDGNNRLASSFVATVLRRGKRGTFIVQSPKNSESGRTTGFHCFAGRSDERRQVK